MTWGELKNIVSWCERNCQHDWKFMEDHLGDMYNSWVFLFESERDYVAFTLWMK